MRALGILLAAVVGIGISRYYFDDHFAPLGLFCVGWLIPLGVSELSLSAMQEPLDGTTWLFIIGSTATYLAGLLVAVLAHRRPEGNPPKESILGLIDARSLRQASLALLALSIVTFAYEVRVAGTVPMLAPPEARTIVYRAFALPFIHYGTISSIPAASLAFLHLRLFGRQNWKLPAFVFVSGSLLIASILARQELLLIIVACLLILAYTASRPLRTAPLVVAALAVAWLFVIIGQGRGGSSEFAAQISGTYLPTWGAGLVWPYLYLALNFTVFQFLSHAGLAATAGANTLQPILSFTLTRRFFPLPVVEDEFGWFNTFTYLWPLYSDFRVWGVILIPSVYGLFSGWYYLRFRSRPNAARLLIYTLVAFTTLFLFQSNGFTFPAYYLFAFEFWLAIKFASRVESPTVT
jgi:oligosaccharide repeat unit polymerase